MMDFRSAGGHADHETGMTQPNETIAPIRGQEYGEDPSK